MAALRCRECKACQIRCEEHVYDIGTIHADVKCTFGVVVFATAGDLDGSGLSYDEVTAEEFSAACGCPEDSIIPTAPASSITTPGPNAPGTLVCGELDPFSITVAVASLDDVEGCYQEAGTAYQEEGGHFFSITGKPGPAQMAVFPGYADAASIDVSCRKRSGTDTEYGGVEVILCFMLSKTILNPLPAVDICALIVDNNCVLPM